MARTESTTARVASSSTLYKVARHSEISNNRRQAAPDLVLTGLVHDLGDTGTGLSPRVCRLTLMAAKRIPQNRLLKSEIGHCPPPRGFRITLLKLASLRASKF
ncbi:hypothetical protein WAI453_011344 [Rhynchosporium graminicola]